ncbi:MAG: hypothetical protein EHM48_09065 [Planctomycetaceae bacterium]|nr:MAG: hypothetical protein EHM48_09065 [Planctomycetaceae bacterium]
MAFIKHRARFIVLGLVFAGLACFAIFHCYAKPETPFPGFHEYQNSTSPDGRYKCVVVEKTPTFLMASPYLYRIAIIGIEGHKIGLLPGDSLEINKDSCVLSKEDITWDADGVTIGSAENPLARCVIQNGRQCWTDYRLIPSRITSPSTGVSSTRPNSLPTTQHLRQDALTEAAAP